MSNEMNQSLKVLLVRFGVDPKMLWPLLAVVVLGVTALGMRRAFAAGWPSWALGLNALGTLLVSPVSYSHHWVWIVPILLTGAVFARRTRRTAVTVAVVAGTLLFVLAPHWWWEPKAPWHAWRRRPAPASSTARLPSPASTAKLSPGSSPSSSASR